MYIYILSYTYAFYIYYFKEVFSYMIDSSTNLANTSSNKPHNYHEQSQIDQTLRLREVLKTLPPFVKDYFRAMEPKSSARTRINYAYDIRVFFHFLMENNPVYKNYTIDRFMTIATATTMRPLCRKPTNAGTQPCMW